MPDALILARSAYSFLRGSASPAALVGRAAALGWRHIALADAGNLCGALAFLDACRAHRLHGILGVELPLPVSAAGSGGAGSDEAQRGAQRASGLRSDVAGPKTGACFLLAHDLEGYRTIAAAISRFQLDGAAAAARAVAEDARGITLLSPSAAALEPWRAVLGGARLGLLVRRGCSGGEVARQQVAARRLRLPLVAAEVAPLLAPAEAETRMLQEAMRTHTLLGSEWGQERRARRGGEADALLLAPGELRRRFGACPEALRMAEQVAGRCRLTAAELTPPRAMLPNVAGAEGLARLRRLCRAGLRRRPLGDRRRARARLEQELGVVATLGFVDYFLIVADLVRWAHRRGIRTVGRGSGAASLIAYLIGVTNIDPIRYDLCFERFLHPLRRDMPDLDIDIAWDRRDEVLAYALARFGRERAALVGTHPCFGARGAFHEAGRALGLADAAIARGARRLPRGFFGQRVPATDPAAGPSALGEGLGEEGAPPAAGGPEPDERRALQALAASGEPAHRRAARAALHLLGLPRTLGTHPGGIVLADGPLGRTVPLQRCASGWTVTQFEMHGIERIGLVKIDLLGNRALGTVAEATRLLAASSGDGGKHAGRALARAVATGGTDPRVAGLLAAGATLGCFQIESPAMRTLLCQLRPRDLDELIAAVALIRPGPAGSGMKAAFIRRARGQEPVTVPDRRLAATLRTTHGLPLYEEDIIRMAAVIGGLSLAEGDLLRRAVGEAARRARNAPAASEAARAVAALESGFLRAARAQGVARCTARAVWGDLLRFAAYAFCKAHAAGYGTIAYQTAWLKAHHPGPFFGALLNHQRGMYPLRVYVDEARRWGLRLLPPCVLRSGRGWAWVAPENCGTPGMPDSSQTSGTADSSAAAQPARGALRCGLGLVRGLRTATLEAILAARRQRPFEDLADLARRTGANAPELEALVLSGACDAAWGAPRGEMLWHMRRFLRARGRRAALAGGVGDGLPQPSGGPSAAQRADQTALRLTRRRAARADGPWKPVSSQHRARLERRYLGVSLSLHPLALAAAQRPPRRVHEIRADVGGRVELVAIVSALRRVRAADGRRLVFVTLEDESGLIEASVGPALLARGVPAFTLNDYLRVRGRLRRTLGAPHLALDELAVVGRH